MNCLHRRLSGAMLLLLISLLCRGQPPMAGAAVPPPLASALQQLQTRDDLSGWIYQQIQYVAKAPASRSSLLVHAVDEAWRHPRTAEEVQAWQDLLINEGYALLLSGAIVPSTDAYTAAYDWASRHPEGADSVSMVEYILKPLGNNYTRLGDYEQALFIHQKALALAGSGKDNEALAGTYSNLANTCSNMGRPQESLEYCRKGLAVANTSSALFGLLLSEQADACQQLQRWDEARSSIDKSIGVLERSIHRDRNSAAGYWLLMAYQQAGDIYLAQPTKALSYYQRALALQDQLSQQQGEQRQRERAKLFQRLSVLYARLHQDARSIYWSDQCLSVLIPGKRIGALKEADLYAENTLADVLYTRAGLAKKDGSTDEAIRLYALCFAVGKKLRQELITGSSRELAVADTRSQYEEAISAAWDAWEHSGNKKYAQAMLYFMESSKAQLLLEEVIRQQPTGGRYPGDSLESRVRLLERARVYYEKEALQSPQNDSITAAHAAQEKQVAWELAQVRKRLGTTRREYLSGAAGYGNDAGFSIDSLHVLLDGNQLGRLFFSGQSALYVVECSATGINFVEKLPVPAHWEDSVRGFISTWFQRGANAIINDPLRYYREAFGFYRMLFGTHPLQPGKEYILFPDGALSLLPVEALVTDGNCPPSPADWPFVIKQASLSYGWSLQTLLRQRTNAATASGFAGFFLSANHGSSPLLEAVGAEEEGIKRTVKSGNWYVDSQATAARFYQALDASAVVHVSSHAFTQKGGLDVPHIELYDEPFYLFELQGMTHHPALVVLSACRTADGRMVTGEGVQSLARAFTAGGAKAVVAGWWNLNDETAAQLMERYYAALTEDAATGDRVNAADALRKVKLAWLSDATVPYLHKLPYFWAGLGYLGDPTPVNKGFFGEKKGPRWWPLLVAICAVIIILVYVRGRRGHNPG